MFVHYVSHVIHGPLSVEKPVPPAGIPMRTERVDRTSRRKKPDWMDLEGIRADSVRIRSREILVNMF